jgi:hypothetical protein
VKKSFDDEDNVTSYIGGVPRKQESLFPKEKHLLEKQKDEIDFLKENVFEFLEVGDVLKNHEKIMLAYNLLKYYIVLLKNFKDSLNKN